MNAIEEFLLLRDSRGRRGTGGGGGFVGTTFNGARVSANHFGATNKMESTDLVQFNPGKTLILVMDHQSAGAIGNEVVFSSGRGSFGLGIGYALAIGQGTHDLYLVNYAGAFVLLATSLRIGINTIVIKYKADTSWVVSLNGLTVTTAAGIGTLSYDGSCFTEIGQGSPTDTQITLQSGGVLSVSMANEELTDADVRAYSSQVGSVNRLVANPAFTALASNEFDWNAYRDWNGIASTSVSHGSAPVTFTVGGTVTRTDFSEVRYATVQAMYDDSKIETPTTSDYGETFTRRNAYARLNVTASGDRVSFEAGATAGNGTFGAGYASIGVYSNGTFVDQQVWNTGELIRCSDVMLSAGANKSVDVNEGGQWLQTEPRGTYVTAMRVRVGDTLNHPAAPTKRTLLFVDSIGTGFKATNLAYEGTGMLLRYGGTAGSVSVFGWGSATTKNFMGDASLRTEVVGQILALCNATVTNQVMVQIGTNDYGLAVWTVAAYKAAWKAVIQAVHLAKPSVKFIFVSPIQRISPDTEAANGNGDTLGDLRTAQSEIAAEETFTTYHNGGGGAIIDDANLDGDGIHPKDAAAQLQLATNFISFA